MPIYRQIIDQIKYQIAAGLVKAGDKVPSVRQLAIQLAVNQNTILKVYNELCREGVLRIERGEGTYVSSAPKSLTDEQVREMLGGPLREAAVLAMQLGIDVEQVGAMLKDEYDRIHKKKTANERE